MQDSLIQQLKVIEKSNTWIKSSLEGNKSKEAYRKMVNCRRKLNKKRYALEGNPAAAMYGESQAGKSYLVSALLSEPSKPFSVFDGNGKEYDFKTQINPRGNEMESTSLVTRFSIKHQIENKDYPVIAKLLSPTDLILVMCEAYYHNLIVDNPLSYDQVIGKVNEFENIYKDREVCQYWIIEDDILDLEEYFSDNFSKAVYNNIDDADFFERLSSFVTKIPPSEWKSVFPLFWHFNEQITKLFDDLIQQYQKVNFSDTVYIPIDAVLRNKGTILDVSRLDEIYGEFKGTEIDYTSTSNVLYKLKDSSEQIIYNYSKPYLCALTAELIFVLPDSMKTKKRFLEQTDLLDFPGTRHYDTTKEELITNETLTYLLRRGKVDYLFNKYSSNEQINVLLFCQNNKQSKQSVMPSKLNSWIEKTIGSTPEDRERYDSEISRFFVISTWFNKDLEYKTEYQEGNKQTLNEIWNQRFSRVLQGEIFKTDTYPWLTNWKTSNKNFQNIYLLRDFDQSSDINSQIFRGYNQYGEEREEIIQEVYPNFRQDLRQSFLNYDFVKRHFANPEESWDESATINKDGTKLIIDKLIIAANNINSARLEKTLIELNEIKKSVLEELYRHFQSNDKDEVLQKAKHMAGDIQFRLATSFAADNIKKYGQLMKELMIDEGSVLELFRKKASVLERRDIGNKDIYSIYRMEVPVEENDTVERYFDRLCIHYEKTTDERKEKFRLELENNNIDLDELIRGDSDLIKNNAQQLAEALLEYWFEYIYNKDKQTVQNILATDSSLDYIKDMYQKLFAKLKFAKQIAGKIRRYVDGHGKTDIPYEIAADISAELLNKFINTVGFDYFDDSEIDDLKEANEQNNLGLILENNTNPTENSLEDLFYKIENWTEVIQSRPEEMKSLSSYRNYLAWSNCLKIGFVSVCDIPNYDVASNAKLGEIIEKCKTIKY